MNKSEYNTQAYVDEHLNQQHGFDSPEGSAALIRPNKPEVDETDIQKERILAKSTDKQAAIQSIIPVDQKKNTFALKNVIHPTASRTYKKS